MNEQVKKYLDSLSDEELLFELSVRFGCFIPVWKEVSKKEYEKNYGKENESELEKLQKFIACPYTYKKEPHWKNTQPGILWQIEHYNDSPDYYTYHKLIKQDFALMLGSDMINYLYNRNPNWLSSWLSKEKL